MHRLRSIEPDALEPDALEPDTFEPIRPSRFEALRTSGPDETPDDGERLTCGARTRRGTPCRSAPVQGRRRCRMHGGASPGAPRGNQHARKHGGYSVSPLALTEDERALWDRIDTRAEAQLDEALRLCTIRERRILRHLRDVHARGEADLDAEDALTTVQRLILRLAELKRRAETSTAGGGELDRFLATLKPAGETQD